MRKNFWKDLRKFILHALSFSEHGIGVIEKYERGLITIEEVLKIVLKAYEDYNLLDDSLKARKEVLTDK